MSHTGDLISELFARYGVGCVFGQPGGQTAALYDGMSRRSDRIRHMLVRDERSGVYAADAYARLTGRPGVCDVTVGPGTTKLTDGLVESLNASIPLVALVGELPRDWAPLADHGVASQGFDQAAFLKTVTKATWIAPSLAALPQLVRSAFRTATSGRPGPVALIVPHDLMDAEWDGAEEDVEIDDRYVRAPAHRPVASPDTVADAAGVLARGRRPVVVAGGGVLGSRATDELTRLAEAIDAVVVTSFSGKGSAVETGPHGGGVLNPLAGEAAKTIVQAADVVFWCGCKVSQNTSLNWTLPSPRQATLHLDIDPIELGRTFRPTVALNGDVRATLTALLDVLERKARPEWLAQVADIKRQAEGQRAAEVSSARVPIAPPRVMDALARRLAPDDVVVSDASFSAGWISTYLPARRAGRNWLFARGMGGLGYAVPAALGAAVARPQSTIVTVSGDGGFSYAVGELPTHAQQGLKVIHLVLNNGTLGWLAMWQEIFFSDLRQSVDLETSASKPDFAAAAGALGCGGMSVSAPDELADALDAAFGAPGPSVLDVRIDPRATPLPSYQRRLEERRGYDRPGTTYQLRPWNRSAELPSEIEEAMTAGQT